MSEITTGVRKILSIPKVYNFFQALIGANQGRKLFVERDLKPSKALNMLDIGCGTAEVLEFLPLTINYVGFDISPEYIKAARTKFSSRNAIFYNNKFTPDEISNNMKFDLVYCSGLLHHLDDNEVIELFKNIKGVLGEEGRFVSVDPCFTKRQRFIPKFLASLDRGQNVRLVEDLEKIANDIFSNVVATERSDFLRLPYDHVVLECKNG